jgi:hypothetical protein
MTTSQCFKNFRRSVALLTAISLASVGCVDNSKKRPNRRESDAKQILDNSLNGRNHIGDDVEGRKIVAPANEVAVVVPASSPPPAATLDPAVEEVNVVGQVTPNGPVQERERGRQVRNPQQPVQQPRANAESGTDSEDGDGEPDPAPAGEVAATDAAVAPPEAAVAPQAGPDSDVATTGQPDGPTYFNLPTEGDGLYCTDEANASSRKNQLARIAFSSQLNTRWSASENTIAQIYQKSTGQIVVPLRSQSAGNGAVANPSDLSKGWAELNRMKSLIHQMVASDQKWKRLDVPRYTQRYFDAVGVMMSAMFFVYGPRTYSTANLDKYTDSTAIEFDRKFYQAYFAITSDFPVSSQLSTVELLQINTIKDLFEAGIETKLSKPNGDKVRLGLARHLLIAKLIWGVGNSRFASDAKTVDLVYRETIQCLLAQDIGNKLAQSHFELYKNPSQPLYSSGFLNAAGLSEPAVRNKGFCYGIPMADVLIAQANLVSTTVSIDSLRAKLSETYGFNESVVRKISEQEAQKIQNATKVFTISGGSQASPPDVADWARLISANSSEEAAQVFDNMSPEDADRIRKQAQASFLAYRQKFPWLSRLSLVNEQGATTTPSATALRNLMAKVLAPCGFLSPEESDKLAAKFSEVSKLPKTEGETDEAYESRIQQATFVVPEANGVELSNPTRIRNLANDFMVRLNKNLEIMYLVNTDLVFKGLNLLPFLDVQPTSRLLHTNSDDFYADVFARAHAYSAKNAFVEAFFITLTQTPNLNMESVDFQAQIVKLVQNLRGDDLVDLLDKFTVEQLDANKLSAGVAAFRSALQKSKLVQTKDLAVGDRQSVSPADMHSEVAQATSRKKLSEAAQFAADIANPQSDMTKFPFERKPILDFITRKLQAVPPGLTVILDSALFRPAANLRDLGIASVSNTVTTMVYEMANLSDREAIAKEYNQNLAALDKVLTRAKSAATERGNSEQGVFSRAFEYVAEVVLPESAENRLLGTRQPDELSQADRIEQAQNDMDAFKNLTERLDLLPGPAKLSSFKDADTAQKFTNDEDRVMFRKIYRAYLITKKARSEFSYIDMSKANLATLCRDGGSESLKQLACSWPNEAPLYSTLATAFAGNNGNQVSAEVKRAVDIAVANLAEHIKVLVTAPDTLDGMKKYITMADGIGQNLLSGDVTVLDKVLAFVENRSPDVEQLNRNNDAGQLSLIEFSNNMRLGFYPELAIHHGALKARISRSESGLSLSDMRWDSMFHSANLTAITLVALLAVSSLAGKGLKLFLSANSRVVAQSIAQAGGRWANALSISYGANSALFSGVTTLFGIYFLGHILHGAYKEFSRPESSNLNAVSPNASLGYVTALGDGFISAESDYIDSVDVAFAGLSEQNQFWQDVAIYGVIVGLGLWTVFSPMLGSRTKAPFSAIEDKLAAARESAGNSSGSAAAVAQAETALRLKIWSGMNRTGLKHTKDLELFGIRFQTGEPMKIDFLAIKKAFYEKLPQLREAGQLKEAARLETAYGRIISWLEANWGRAQMSSTAEVRSLSHTMFVDDFLGGVEAEAALLSEIQMLRAPLANAGVAVGAQSGGQSGSQSQPHVVGGP